MAMTMADDYYGEYLDDVVHRLLPREILADVGIVVAGGGAPVRGRGDEDYAAAVEDLAAHLVGILGLGGARERPRPHLQHLHEQRRRAGIGNGSCAPVCGSQYHGGAARRAPPASCWNGTAPRLPGFGMAAAMNSHPPAMRHGAGTGVFLPRVQAYVQNRESSASPIPRNCAKPPRMQMREAAVLVAMRQQQQLQMRAMAAEMQRQREAFAAAFQFHGCPAIAPPQQWTY